jgi:hypothetical protein
MTSTQKFFQKLLPRRWAEDLQAESQTWLARCPCGYEKSIWDRGGIRWKAAGEPRRRFKCPQCGQTTWHTVYRQPLEPTSHTQPEP